MNLLKRIFFDRQVFVLCRGALAVKAILYSLRRFQAHALFALICLIALILRLFHLSHQSVWFDEIASLTSALQPTVWKVIETTLITERIPPAYPVFLHFWTGLFGFSELWIRLPSALFGLMTVPVVYCIAKLYFDHRIAIISSFLLAVSPFHVWHSQEARCITMMTLLNLLSIFLFLRLMKAEKEFPSFLYWLYFSATVLALCTYYLSILTVLAQNVVFAVHWRKNRKNGARWVLAQASILLLCGAPLLVLLVNQILYGHQMHFGGSTGNDTFTSIYGYLLGEFGENDALVQSSFSRLLSLTAARLNVDPVHAGVFLLGEIPFSFGSGLAFINRPPYYWNKVFVAFFVVPCSLLFAVLIIRGIHAIRDQRSSPLLVFLTVPIIGVLMIKLLGLRPVFARHAMQSLPIAYLYIALALASLKNRLLKVSVFCALILILALSLLGNYFDNRVFKDDWRYVTSHVISRLAENDFIVFHGEYVKASFYYYIYTNPRNQRVWAEKAPDGVEVRGRDGSLNQFVNRDWQRLLAGKENIWVVTYYATEGEKQLLASLWGESYMLTMRNCDLGKNLCFESYRRLHGI
ncbi:MAG: hypothetical protein A4E63_01830 [Syntrophorhabdus sp. PtaU1.Bin050]|nr:MAG: hypothetical protein A4E63_01830 [Syntrophorhabdus sp. PtaU1.Bin050]